MILVVRRKPIDPTVVPWTSSGRVIYTATVPALRVRTMKTAKLATNTVKLHNASLATT